MYTPSNRSGPSISGSRLRLYRVYVSKVIEAIRRAAYHRCLIDRIPFPNKGAFLASYGDIYVHLTVPQKVARMTHFLGYLRESTGKDIE